MKTKLCCTLNTFTEGVDTKYCEDCYRSTIEDALEKNIDWDKVAKYLRDATENFIHDNNHCDSATEYFSESKQGDFVYETFKGILEKIFGPNWDALDESFDEAVAIAWDIRDEYLDNVQARIKIIVE